MRSNRGEEARHINGGGSSIVKSKTRGPASTLKVLIERRCLAPLTLNEDVNGHDDRNVKSSCSSYRKLPQLQYLKLSVLKLDGTVFDVFVVKNATVAELKKGVEEVFSTSPKEGQDKISWSLVWGHFCLSYQGRKLVNDKAPVRHYGIKEGDQLQFVRHMTINYTPLKKIRPKKESIAWKKKSQLSSGSNDMKLCIKGQENDQDNNLMHPIKEEEEDQENAAPQFKMAHFLRGLLSYSKLWGFSRTRSSSSSSSSADCSSRTNRPTRFSLHFLKT
ncbi:uncharacterized protein LOC115705326 [Cannabis sativa]|uniref:uncharacterized protein LOC115705326 n=1 Tax=Cannabis sativa TaxID=3483 RepID=UPI0029CA7B3E|nr:uncharacterized protein LOC115705326 [Cannabis sativa]